MSISIESYELMCSIAFGKGHNKGPEDFRGVFEALNARCLRWIIKASNDGMAFYDDMHIVHFILANKEYTSFPKFVVDVSGGFLQVTRSTAEWIRQSGSDAGNGYQLPKAEQAALLSLLTREAWMVEWVEYWLYCQTQRVSRSSSSSSIASN